MISRLVLLIALCVAMPSLAAQSPQGILAQDEVLDRAQRRDLANSFLIALDRFSGSFPTLTPAEEEYVEEELANSEGERRTKLINSKEYLIWGVRSDIDQLRKHLRRLKGAELPRELEMKHWAAASYHLLNTINDNFNRLREMAVLKERATFAMFADYYGKKILVKAIAEP